MNYFSIFTNKNDLVKVLTIGGLFVLVFSLVYPVEKQKELDLKIVNLNFEKCKLEEYAEEAEKFANITQSKIDSGTLNPSEKDSLREKTGRLKREIKDQKLEVQKLEQEVIVLRNYSHSYEVYTKLFFWGGLLTSIGGLLFWIISGVKEYFRLEKSDK